MNVSCPDCRSIFRVDPAKVPPSGVRARCSVCSGVIMIPAPTGQTTPTGGNLRTTTPVGQSASMTNPPSPSQAAGGWEPPQSQRTSAAPAAARQAPPPTAAPRPAQVPTPVRPRPESVERGPVTATVTPPSPASGLPEFAPPPPPPPPMPPAPPFTPGPSAGSFKPTPAVPSSGPPMRPSSGPSAPPYIPPASSSRVAPPSRPIATPGASTPIGDSGARRPLNPFLSKDPNQRAKRLARALVSDIITYHPAKHAEGLRDGTLKQLFREEIKKSFEEYIAQVGQQLAESTTYFQEALNEVLGAGKKIF
jgi:predicted Zn finger-like uncharacterized protein